MYALAGRLDADLLAAIAQQAYSEMLASGYTSVAEFHYLHSEPGGSQRDDTMFNALCDAADNSGIRMTTSRCYTSVPGFDQPEPVGHQKLFANDVESFLAHHERVRERASETLNVGIGAHSLRAV